MTYEQLERALKHANWRIDMEARRYHELELVNRRLKRDIIRAVGEHRAELLEQLAEFERSLAPAPESAFASCSGGVP